MCECVRVIVNVTARLYFTQLDSHNLVPREEKYKTCEILFQHAYKVNMLKVKSGEKTELLN